MTVESYYLELGLFFVSSGILGFSIYFIDTRITFSMKRFRGTVRQRVEEIRGIFQQNTKIEEGRIQQIMSEYNRDMNIGPLDYVRITLNQSGMNLSFLQFLASSFFLTVLGLFLGLMMSNVWLSIIVPIAFSQILFFIARFRFFLRQAAYRSKSGDIVRQIYNMYSTSRNLIMSMRNSVAIMPSPFKELFTDFFKEFDGNVPFDKAMNHLMERVIDPNFRLFCSLIKVSMKMGMVITGEMKSIRAIYDDEKEVRYQMANEMQKEKTEALLLGLIPIVLQIIAVVVFPHDVQNFLRVGWINTMVGVADTLLIIGFLMLPSIFMLETE